MSAVTLHHAPAGAADASQAPPPAADRLDAALKLLALSGDLQRLGYAYEAFQLHEAAARLLREADGKAR